MIKQLTAKFGFWYQGVLAFQPFGIYSRECSRVQNQSFQISKFSSLFNHCAQMAQDTKFDGILMTMLQQKGNIDAFFDGVYGFLRRNTDFFANQKKAEEIIVNNCKINFEKYTSETLKKQKEEEKKKQELQKKRKLKEEKQRKEKQQQANKAKQAQKVQVQPAKVEAVSTTPTFEQKAEEKKQEDNTPAPKGNGGRTEKYIWTQTLQNLQLYIFLDSAITKKNLKVTITFQKLIVVVNGVTVIDGKWKDKINTEETYWNIVDGEIEDYKGKYICVNVQKWKNQTSWWSTPIQGHTQINTQKINPEPSKLSDLDGETRSTVQKMMFDMRQKQQGLPTSDELTKQEKLKEFMKAHPEMDFSQCKFN